MLLLGMPYRIADHTADVAIELEAADYIELFSQAAVALLELLGAAAPEAEFENMVAVRGVDRADTMVRWLQEVLYLVQVKDLRIAKIRIVELTDTLLKAQLEGGYGSQPLQGEIKAVTYHGLEIKEIDGRLKATVICDT